MADPRGTARTWLADAIHVARNRCDCGRPMVEEIQLADTILNAPGVEVLAEQGRFLPAGSIWRQADNGDQTRPVIRLPAQPVGDPP